MFRKKRLTVLELGHLSSTAVSGGDRLFSQILKYLVADYQVKIIIPHIASGHWQNAKKKYPISIRVLSKDPLPLKNPVFIFLNYLIRSLDAFCALKKEDQTDFLYSSTNIFVDILPAYLFKLVKPKVKWVARVHHLSPPPSKREGNFFVNLFAWLLQILSLSLIKRKADIVFALNENIFQILRQKRFLKAKLKILGTGVDFDKIKKHQIGRNYFFEAVFLGRLHKTKGVFDLPGIWWRVTQSLPKARLAIIGEGTKSILKGLKTQIVKRKLKENVEVLGFLPKEQVFDILKTAKVFLFTDYEAGWGLAIAEAMACGLPVVGYNLPIFGDIFKKGYLAVKLGDKDAFAEKIIFLLKNSRERKKLSNQALSQAQALNLTKVARKLKQALI